LVSYKGAFILVLNLQQKNIEHREEDIILTKGLFTRPISGPNFALN